MAPAAKSDARVSVAAFKLWVKLRPDGSASPPDLDGVEPLRDIHRGLTL